MATAVLTRTSTRASRLLGSVALVAAAMLYGTAGHAQTPAPAAPAAPAAPTGITLEAAVAVVNDEPITITDIRSRARQLLLELRITETTPEVERDAIQRASELLIEEALQRQETARREVTIEAAEIDAGVARYIEALGLSLQDLAQVGVSVISLRKQVEAQIAWQTLIQGYFGSRVRISETQIDDTLDQIAVGATQTQFQLSEIFAFTPDEASRTQAVEAMTQLRERIEAQGPQAFEFYARQVSDSPSAASGGDLQWVSLGTMAPEIDAALNQIQGPGVIGPIATFDGIYLLQVSNRREPITAGPADVRVKRALVRNTDPAARTKIEAVRTALSGATCDQFEAIVAATEGATAANLGTVSETGLDATTRAAVAATAVGGVTEVIEAASGPTLLMICERSTSAGPRLPTREQIQGSLLDRQLTMLADRYLRDLRRQGTILRKQG
jgi:peptidyl-prolyl cis-trans isomerase SurA